MKMLPLVVTFAKKLAAQRLNKASTVRPNFDGFEVGGDFHTAFLGNRQLLYIFFMSRLRPGGGRSKSYELIPPQAEWKYFVDY